MLNMFWINFLTSPRRWEFYTNAVKTLFVADQSRADLRWDSTSGACLLFGLFVQTCVRQCLSSASTAYELLLSDRLLAMTDVCAVLRCVFH